MSGFQRICSTDSRTLRKKACKETKIKFYKVTDVYGYQITKVKRYQIIVWYGILSIKIEKLDSLADSS